MKKEKFINSLKEGSIKGWKKYKVLPSLTIAQAILETGWGSSSLGNNLFGIKADKYWVGKKQLARTHEYVNGKKIYIDAWFREYDTIYESLEDRYKFLHKPRYAKVIGEANYKKACKAIWKAGYATDPKYPNKLIAIIEQNKLQEIDKVAMSNLVEKSIVKEDKVSSWAKNEWNWATKKGYLDGSRPSNNLSREEFAIIIQRVVG